MATAVVVMHLTDLTRIAGYQAVFSFYILSGYLMTRVLNETYGFSADGRNRFLLNRFLRIFPPYWIAALISIAVILITPELARSMNEGLVLPQSLSEWLLNIFIFFHSPPGETARLIPPVWTLHVEWMFYLAMCFVLSRSKLIVHGWFYLSAIMTACSYLWVVLLGKSFTDHLYFSTFAGSLPFSFGAAIYFYAADKESPVERNQFAAYLATLTGIVVFFVFATAAHNKVREAAVFHALFYANLAVSGVAVYVLHGISRTISSSWAKADRALGDLSYPIYLLHWPIAAWVALVFFGSEKRIDLLFFAVAYLATIGVSLLVNRFVEKPIGNIRKLFRNGGVPRALFFGMKSPALGTDR